MTLLLRNVSTRRVLFHYCKSYICISVEPWWKTNKKEISLLDSFLHYWANLTLGKTKNHSELQYTYESISFPQYYHHHNNHHRHHHLLLNYTLLTTINSLLYVNYTLTVNNTNTNNNNNNKNIFATINFQKVENATPSITFLKRIYRDYHLWINHFHSI